MIWQEPILNFMPEVIKCSFTLLICIWYQSTGSQQLVLCPSWRVCRGQDQVSQLWPEIFMEQVHMDYSCHPVSSTPGWSCRAFWMLTCGSCIFCQMFIQCSVSPLLSLVYLIISSGCLAVETAHLSFIPTQQSPPTFHSQIPRNALLMASHSAVPLALAGTWKASSPPHRGQWLWLEQHRKVGAHL